jgi:radical SAM protein with 4Fe4S-binding SPASM domain
MPATADAIVMASPLPENAPPGFHLLAKPSGSTCNIDCGYCFFLSKEALYPNDKHRMSEATLEAYIRQLLESHRTPQVTVAWQGGEPTLMKLEFFQRAVELVDKHRQPDQTVQHTFQTNGLLLDDDWCGFFKQHGFLVGLSVDGPRELHDTYRVDRRGQGTFDLVMRGWRLLRQHGVEFNILCTVNAANQQHGRTVYRFFRDELGAKWVQFGQDKRDTLTQQCRNCKVLHWCNGGCPKDRFARSRDGEPGQNYLCAGLELFCTHTGPTFHVMVQLLRQGRAPADVMAWIAAEDAKRGPYRACPCGSGRKFRFCHGDKAPGSTFSRVERAAPTGGSAAPQ